MNTDQITWQPSVDTGLSGEAHLSIELEEFVDDLSDAHRPGVYVVALSIPATTDFEKHAHLWLDEFDTIPEYLQQVATAEKVLYVGAAENVYQRLEEHLERPNRSAAIANVFPIHSIRYVKWCDTTEEAFAGESAVASDLSTAINGYVHSR